MTVDQDALTARSGVGLEATLDQLPQFNLTGTGSASQASAASTPFPQADAAPGAATVNLRGLGSNRTLVLIDGRRAQPANGQLIVDLNTIPSAAVDRIEILTGGAAAVYGADAVAGVVNVILKKDFQGIQVNAQSSTTQARDGAESNVSGLIGTSFADGRGSVLFGADYLKRDGVMGKHRDWVVRGWNDPGTMGGDLGSSNLSQLVTPAGCCASFPLPPGGSYAIDQNGHVFNPQAPQDPAHPYTGPLGGASGFKINPDGSLGFNDQEHSYLQLSLERYSLFGTSHIALSDGIDLFAQVHYANTYTIARGPTSNLSGVWSPTIPYDPLYDDPASPLFGQAPPGTAQHPVPAEVAALLNQRANPAAPWTYAGGLDYLEGGGVETDTTGDVYQIVGGLSGRLSLKGHDLNWTLYVAHGSTSVSAYQPKGFPSFQRLQNLFNANHYGVGFDVSQLPDYVPSGVAGHCTSGLPIFNPDGSVDNAPSVSQDCFDYVTLQMNSITNLEQNIFEGTMTGTLLDTKSGPWLFAVGGDQRKEQFWFQPDSGYNANQDFPNVVQSLALPVSVTGTTTTKELYGELAVPLWKNRIELDPGVRVADQDTVGTATTYKLLGQAKAGDRIRLRGGYQRATRAPNVVELFTPTAASALVAGTDPCGNWIVNGTSLTQAWGNRAGNPHRLNVQTLCQYLMTREGAPATFYVPGTPSADDYAYNVFGGTGYYPFDVAIRQGNRALAPERADTRTAGVVLSPKFARHLAISLDWYRIELDHAIAVPGHDAVYQQCLDAAYNPTVGSTPGTYTGAQMAAGNAACALIQREYLNTGAPGTPGNTASDRRYSAQYVNQGAIRNEGYDLQLDWSAGHFNVGAQTSVLTRYAESPFPGAAFVDYTGTAQNSSFRYRFLSTLRWGKGPLSIGGRWQRLPKLNPVPGSSPAALPILAHDQLDVFGNWSFKSHWTLRGGVDNLLNADPAWVGRTLTNNAVGTTDANYDVLGRRLFVGVQLNL
ncbi:MAG TPA: TonB-dependent receptor [Gammaproteobacteria bacterium]|nr:TonB-dependent receptor [Gammaproteobacteria bacterium]